MADESKHRDQSSIDANIRKDEGDIGSRANEGSPSKNDLGYQGNKNERNYDKGNMDRDKDVTRNPGDMNKPDQKNDNYGTGKGNMDYKK